MKLIKPKYEIIEQEAGEDGIYKMIELAGRTCYKSEDKITPDSARGFVERMIKSGHGAMLEHGTVYLDMSYGLMDRVYEMDNKHSVQDYIRNPYSRVNIRVIDNFFTHYYVTTNLRVLVENDWLDDLQYLCEPTEYHERRVTVKFTCDRGVSHEFVRHRVFSFAQESSRYCNYSKDKFGHELTFIIPTWIDTIHDGDTFSYDANIDMWQKSEDANASNFLQSIAFAEKTYLTLLFNGWKPQQARAVLPNALKTELVMTGFVSDWKHFFELRDDAHAHPQAQELAKPLHEDFIKKGYIKDEGAKC